ncbi:MAG: aldose 1-epimerase family protein [Bacteroidales bacterium]|nr:aldose 1-epimerase family protein [Bacteroidales bacterium]
MKLSNSIISIEVSEHGAELVSLQKGGREYMWCGDAQYWNRHAPILFPAVGKPYNNEIHIGGKSYVMKQHGFARDSEFKEIGNGCLQITNTNHAEVYPYNYSLTAQYRLIDNSVEITWTVLNLDNQDMHFQIGAHSGFLLQDYNLIDPIHGYVHYYDRNGKLISPIIISSLDDGNRIPCTPALILANMPIEEDTFAHDALIFENGQVATAELCDKQGHPILSVKCPQAEAFGVWAPHKKGCPFICLEPWCGICDVKGFVGDISKRTYSHRLAPGGQYQFSYVIEVL